MNSIEIKKNAIHKTTIAAIQYVISSLKYRRQGWFLTNDSKQIKMTKKLNGRVISVIFVLNKKGKYEIKPALYDFRSTISHFDYFEPEFRWSRNKRFFIQLIKVLKDANVWSFFDTTNFLKVNDLNSKANQKKLDQDLQNYLK